MLDVVCLKENVWQYTNSHACDIHLCVCLYTIVTGLNHSLLCIFLESALTIAGMPIWSHDRPHSWNVYHVIHALKLMGWHHLNDVHLFPMHIPIWEPLGYLTSRSIMPTYFWQILNASAIITIISFILCQKIFRSICMPSCLNVCCLLIYPLYHFSRRMGSALCSVGFT